jgi:hypothetical protein
MFAGSPSIYSNVLKRITGYLNGQEES